MDDFSKMSINELQEKKRKLEAEYEAYKAQKLNLDMSRGKPCSEQLDISSDMLKDLNCYKTQNGTDVRNYGLVDGIPELKNLFAEIMEADPKEVIVGGNSSLNMMYDTIVRAMLFGVPGSIMPWGKLPKIKFLCPSPGYDRHFAICEQLGIEMITVEIKSDGPDMDMVEKLVAEDESIKGIWCTPKYSNPDGITYSDEVVRRFAEMKTKAPDFRIFWDNAYVVHHLSDTPDRLKNILAACKEAGNPDRVLIFSSTSKISFPGAGVAAMASSENNIDFAKKKITIQTIGPDKINQLRHAKRFKNLKDVEEHMKVHAALIKPKFDAVLDILQKELDGKNIAWWNKPNGGYFISLNTLNGCAKKIVKMAADAGVVLTGAGATYPYGKDPNDKNIRIAPTFPPIDELKKAIEILCICVQLTSIEKLLEEK